MELNICPRCKTENAPNQKYCKGCGFTLPNTEAQTSKRNFPVLRPNGERAKAAMYSMGLMLALMIPAMLIQGMMTRMIILVMYADQVPIAALGAGILAQLALSFLLLIVSICTMVLFFMWFRRAYYNLRLIKGKTRYVHGWAVGGWFIPIVHLFMPYQIMQELFRDTRQMLLDANPSNAGKLPKNWVGLWWTLILMPIIFIIIVVLSIYIPMPYIMLNIGGIIMSVSNIASPLITIKIIYDYAKMEKLLNQ